MLYDEIKVRENYLHPAPYCFKADIGDLEKLNESQVVVW